jgi:hypothetical protein
MAWNEKSIGLITLEKDIVCLFQMTGNLSYTIIVYAKGKESQDQGDEQRGDTTS